MWSHGPAAARRDGLRRRVAQIQLKDPCGFDFATSGPEAFVFRAELFCCRPSAGARPSSSMRTYVITRDVGWLRRRAGAQVGWKLRSPGAWQGLALLCTKTLLL